MICIPSFVLVAQYFMKKKFPSVKLMPEFLKQDITTAKVREVVEWIWTDGINQNWIFVKNKAKFNKIIILITPGFTPSLLVQKDEKMSLYDVPSEMSFLNEKIIQFVGTKTPGERNRVYSYIDDLLTSKLSKEQFKESQREASQLISLKDLLMSAKLLEENKFPPYNFNPLLKDDFNEENARKRLKLEVEEGEINDDKTFDELVDELVQVGYISTCKSVKGHKSKDIVVIDCEMVMTEYSECARVTIMDFDEKVLYDEFVKPEHKVVDYLTEYSGITEEILKETTKTLSQVQQEILEIIHEETIIIGHGLENDLHALRLIHKNVVDTSVIFDHGKGRGWKPSLKFLAQRFLNSEIQQKLDGHDPREDALAALKLTKLKIQKGKAFGKNKLNAISLFKKLSSFNKKSAIVDSLMWHEKDVEHYIRYDSNDPDKHLSNIKESLEKADFIWTRLKTMMAYQNLKDKDEETRIKYLKEFDDQIKSIYDFCPENSLIILCSGQGDSSEFSKLIEEKLLYQNMFGSQFMNEKIAKQYLWTPEKEKLLEDAASICRKGLSAFLKMSCRSFNQEEQEKVELVLSVTEIDDFDLAVKILEENNWQVQDAINAILDNNTDKVETNDEMHAPKTTATSYIWRTIRYVSNIFYGVLETILNWIFAPIRAILPPTKHQSSEGFINYFRGKYNLEPPKFFIGTPSLFMIFYLHKDGIPDCDNVAKNVVASERFKEFLVENEIMIWGGDVTYSLAYDFADRILKVPKYPFFALAVATEQNRLQILSAFKGEIEKDTMIETFKERIDEFNQALVTERDNNRRRESERSIRDEQNDAYLASLRADEEKKKRKEMERIEKLNRENEAKRILEERKRKRLELKEKFKNEITDQGDICRILIRLSDGTKIQRKFKSSDTVKDLYDFLEGMDVVPLEMNYHLCTSMPKKQLLDMDVTLVKAGLCPSSILFVEENYSDSE
ncbi:hypothetical protein ROZALSC1DRAFT_28698 [Rozella allomycis CSF55]|uniref:UBX domain-containing protein n=1 Tax=Rozella allomycis (strain CSF55) TaxID=988480 RepID=A0A4P9YKQ5_ROZAC|nr:hypothetical protein ROZALSC1DRAFT_28698 [Rozella allomycis CSF55]